jgi:hypothetical protein
MLLGTRPTGAGKNHGCPAFKVCFTQGRECRIKRTIGKWRRSVKGRKDTPIHRLMQAYGRNQNGKGVSKGLGLCKRLFTMEEDCG